MEEKIKELGNYINKLREERKLGFNQLARKSGVNVKTLNDIEITKNDNLIDLSLLDEEEKKILKSIYDLLLQKKWSSKKRPY